MAKDAQGRIGKQLQTTNQGSCSENWQRHGLVQLTLSRGKKKKGDEVENKDNDDVVRTSVAQDSVPATLYR